MAKLYSSSTWPSALSICPFATSPSPSKFFTYGSFRQDAECLGREHSLKGKYHLSANLLFIGFVFNCFARASLVWLNPNQSNRRSAVQWYFPLWWVLSGLGVHSGHHQYRKFSICLRHTTVHWRICRPTLHVDWICLNTKQFVPQTNSTFCLKYTEHLS